jgi:hypothetical protein
VKQGDTFPSHGPFGNEGVGKTQTCHQEFLPVGLRKFISVSLFFANGISSSLMKTLINH